MGMAINSPVLVMALYDIGRDGWSSFSLSYDTYLHWMRNTLSLNCKIVIYTEEKFIEEIEGYRKEFDPSFENTVLIKEPLEQLYYYKHYYDKFFDLMNSEDFRNKTHSDVPEMIRPLYNIIMFNKVEFLKDVKDKRYFDNDLLMWVDAGGLRDNIGKYKGEIWPSLDKVNQLDNSKVTFFSHSKNIIVNNKESHALSQVRFIQGTAFMVPSNLIDSLAQEFKTTVDECLENGYIGSDEKIFDITYCKDPSKYNLIKCDWRTYFNILKQNSPDLYDKKGNQSNNVFIDCGSYECSSLRKKVDELDIDSSWDVHVFEPNPIVDTEKFSSAFSSCRVKVHKKAVWVRDGRTIFNQYGTDGKNQGSLLEETDAGRWYGNYFGSVIVESIDILSFIKSFDPNKEIYLFMDIEHSEYKVLERMVKLGWPNNIKKLWVEWHDSRNSENSRIIEFVENALKETKTEIHSTKI
jgi:FkbM family methyltransferase